MQLQKHLRIFAACASSTAQNVTVCSCRAAAINLWTPIVLNSQLKTTLRSELGGVIHTHASHTLCACVRKRYLHHTHFPRSVSYIQDKRGSASSCSVSRVSGGESMSSEEEEESSLDEDEDMPGLESVSSSEVGINHHHHTSNPSRARASSVVTTGVSVP